MTCMQYYLIKCQQGVECCILLLCEGCMMIYSDWAIMSMSCRFWPCRRCQPSRVLTLSLPPMPGHSTGLVVAGWGGNWKLWKQYLQLAKASSWWLSGAACIFLFDFFPKIPSAPFVQACPRQPGQRLPAHLRCSRSGQGEQNRMNAQKRVECQDFDILFAHVKWCFHVLKGSMQWQEPIPGDWATRMSPFQKLCFLRTIRHASREFSLCTLWRATYLFRSCFWCPPKSRAERWKPAWLTLQKMSDMLHLWGQTGFRPPSWTSWRMKWAGRPKAPTLCLLFLL